MKMNKNYHFERLKLRRQEMMKDEPKFRQNNNLSTKSLQPNSKFHQSLAISGHMTSKDKVIRDTSKF